METMNTMNLNTNDNEAVYGNEVKRRRINQAGDHLKVWQVCNVEYMSHEKKQKAEMKPAQEPVYEVQEPVHQEPVHQEQDHQQQDHQDQQVQEPPVQLIGRTVVLETTDQRICRGTIQELFVLNGERAIHILTDDGQNRIYTTSQLCAACVLYNNAEEEVMSPIPRREEEDEVVRHEVVHIDSDDSDDDEEVQELTRRMEVVEIDSDSDSDSDATTQQLEDEDDYQDDFPDVEFQPSRRQESRQEQAQEQAQEHQEQEDDCCAICLDATDPARNFVSLNCGHQFHFACMMGNMANGGHNRNQCPMCRDRVIHADDDAQNLYAVHEELNLMRQHREDLTAEYVRVMGMQLQINLRYHEERGARDALERRAYICGLNERIAAVVVNAANNDIRRQDGAAVHAERQIRDLCMSFGMMAYDAQYDHQDQYPEYQDQEEPEPEPEYQIVD
jgi:hypothetical protein